MRRLFQHLVIFAAVNSFLIAIWVLIGGGSMEKLQELANDPSQAISLGFWPVFPMLAWGTAVVIHAGFATSNLVFGGTKRDAKKRIKGDIAKEVMAAIDRTHERRSRHRDPRPKAVVASVPGRRWVTVMFCDIADSTSHNERIGDDEWHRVLAHLRGVVRAALTQRGGAEVGTQGDGMLSRFESPADAVLCAIDVQTELGEARASSDFVPELRIGVHAGDAVEDEGDLIGRVINLASRVTDEAVPGEILVTEPVADQLVGRMELEDKGLRTLKGLSQPRHLLAVRWGSSTSDAQT